MKLGYQQATIGFCVDLTSPSSEIIPIANLLVSEADGRQVAGVALLVPEHLDPLTKAVLNVSVRPRAFGCSASVPRRFRRET